MTGQDRALVDGLNMQILGERKRRERLRNAQAAARSRRRKIERIEELQLRNQAIEREMAYWRAVAIGLGAPQAPFALQFPGPQGQQQQQSGSGQGAEGNGT